VISVDAITMFVDQEIEARDQKIKDGKDNPGKDPWHESYFTYLDTVQERLVWCKEQEDTNRGKCKKRLTAQQTGKQQAKSSLTRSCSQKPGIKEVLGDSSSGSDSDSDRPRSALRSASTQSSSTLRSARKKQRKNNDMGLLLSSVSAGLEDKCMEGQEAVSPSHVAYHLAKPPKEPTSLMAPSSLMVLRYIDSRNCALIAQCVQLFVQQLQCNVSLQPPLAVHCYYIDLPILLATHQPFIELAHTQRTNTARSFKDDINTYLL
jgi:hypothetical protein